LGQHHHVLARLVVHPAVIRAGDRSPVVAVALAQARAAVRADVLDRRDGTIGAAEGAQVVPQQRDLAGPAVAHLAGDGRGVAVVAEAELRDQGPDVTREPRNRALDRPLRLGAAPLSAKDRLRLDVRHGGLLWRRGSSTAESLAPKLPSRDGLVKPRPESRVFRSHRDAGVRSGGDGPGRVELGVLTPRGNRADGPWTPRSPPAGR